VLQDLYSVNQVCSLPDYDRVAFYNITTQRPKPQQPQALALDLPQRALLLSGLLVLPMVPQVVFLVAPLHLLEHLAQPTRPLVHLQADCLAALNLPPLDLGEPLYRQVCHSPHLTILIGY